MNTRHPNLLNRDEAVLIVVDMQEPFLRGIADHGRLLANACLLIHSAVILNIPILATTQYAERMGGLVPEIAALLPSPSRQPMDKLSFSCVGDPAFMRQLKDLGRRQIVLCGVETHICIAQTALDLIHSGYQTHVAADAVSARSVEKHKLGMERIRDSAVLPCASESAVYEWLREAQTPEFKAILKIIK